MDGLISIKAEVEDCIKDLTGVIEQIPFATSRALNKTAFDCKGEIKKRLPSIFDRPTPWTLDAMKVAKSDKRNLTAALVYKEWASKGTASGRIMAHHVIGGSRPFKSIEHQLQDSGKIPTNSFIVPTSHMKLNQYGNVTGPFFNKLLSGLQAQRESINNSKGKKALQFYVSRRKRFIFYKEGPGIKPVPLFAIVKLLNYDRIYDPEQIINVKTNEVFGKNFEDALDYALNAGFFNTVY